MTKGPLAPSALDPDQLALAEVARAWLVDRSPMKVVRECLEAAVADPAAPAALPPFWDELASMGWASLAVPAEYGGQGAGLAELAVVLEEWGRAVAPGPFPGTALVATVLGAYAPHLVGPLVDGAAAAVALHGLDGPVDGGAEADWLLVPEGVPERGGPAGPAGATERWALVGRDGFTATVAPGADPTRRPARVALTGEVPAHAWFDVPADRVQQLAIVLASTESVGVAGWCVHAAADWACTREQFDRPIGQFQAVKHRCAEALCRLELARAATWDASGLDPDDPEFPLAAAAAGAHAPAAAFECAKDAIQVLGGIGYTWEHDAHLFLRRATLLRHLSPSPASCRAEIVRRAREGQRRAMRLDLPDEAEGLRDRVRAEVVAVAARPRADWNTALADGGWLNPHWPAPWGRDASPLEQLVIDEELAAAGIKRRHLQVAGWVLPTLIAHGTPDQQARWVPASLRAELTWCQLFSEPGAGSDLASLSTRAERTEGGWLLTGQKVWTTMAREADFGLCLARTDPAAAKHEGISCFVVDMSSPGIDVRPLRELTGFALFNEVFLDAVNVSDDCVVGAVDDGWRCARTTLENERVSMASGSSFGPGVIAVLELAEARGVIDDPLTADAVGQLLVTSQALAVLGLRTTLRAITGAGGSGAAVGSGAVRAMPGPEASVRKLMAVEHEPRVQEAAMAILGADAVLDEGEGQRWFAGFLGNRALSIAGGTSEIQRTIIGDRILGLPR